MAHYPPHPHVAVVEAEAAGRRWLRLDRLPGGWALRVLELKNAIESRDQSWRLDDTLWIDHAGIRVNAGVGTDLATAPMIVLAALEEFARSCDTTCEICGGEDARLYRGGPTSDPAVARLCDPHGSVEPPWWEPWQLVAPGCTTATGIPRRRHEHIKHRDNRPSNRPRLIRGNRLVLHAYRRPRPVPSTR